MKMCCVSKGVVGESSRSEVLRCMFGNMVDASMWLEVGRNTGRLKRVKQRQVTLFLNLSLEREMR